MGRGGRGGSDHGEERGPLEGGRHCLVEPRQRQVLERVHKVMAHTQPHACALDCTHQTTKGVTTAARDTTRHDTATLSCRGLKGRLCGKVLNSS